MYEIRNTIKDLQKPYESIKAQAEQLLKLSQSFVRFINNAASITALAANTKLVVIQVGAFADGLLQHDAVEETETIEKFKYLSNSFSYTLNALPEADTEALFSYCSAYEGFDFWSRLSSLLHYDYDRNSIFECYQNIQEFLYLFSDLLGKLNQIDCITTGSSTQLFINEPTIAGAGSKESTLIFDDNFKAFETTEGRRIFEQILQNLKKGFFLLKIPDIMQLGVSKRVVASIAESLKLLEEKYPVPVIKEIAINQSMQLKLAGEHFKIEGPNDEPQIMNDANIAKWNWDITPLKSGKQHLILNISIKNLVATGNETQDWPIEERIIDVQINPAYTLKRFFINNWQWLIGTVIGSGITITLLKLLKIIT